MRSREFHVQGSIKSETNHLPSETNINLHIFNTANVSNYSTII